MVGISDITGTAFGHAMVTIVAVPATSEPYVQTAWRLIGAADLAPTEALLTVIERAGMTVHVGDISALFVASLTSVRRSMKADATPGIRCTIEAAIRTVAAGTQFSWAYAVDDAKYQASLIGPPSP